MPMKTSSANDPRPVVKRSSARNCLLVNQLATPGLGSLMGGQIIAGTVQLILALVGFCLVIGWFVETCMDLYRQMNNLPPEPNSYSWMGKTGLLAFTAAWLLAWITSLSLLRQARQNEPAATPSKPLPPIIR